MTTPRVLLTYAVLGVALWPVPLLNIVHVESAAVVAFVAFFVAGWAALAAFNRAAPVPVRHVLATQGAALLVPLALLTVSLLWTPNCDYTRGLLFYGLFPGITVVFAVAVAYALSGTGWPFQKTMLAGLGLGVAALGPLYDLGLHPQFYTYNHVFGGVLGPIYDEELAVRPGLFAFRTLTLLWAALAYLAGRWLRGYAAHGGERTGRVVLMGLIGAAYLAAGALGFNTPAWVLQRELGGHYPTDHFDIYYDPASVEPHELQAIAQQHEYRYAWLEGQLQMEGPDRIISYLYPDEGAKARLTGARATSVAPVWLSQPQLHVLLDRYDATFGHELVHVFSRQFGLPVLNASWAVGLVEGTAVALEPPRGAPTPREQVSAALLSAERTAPRDVAAQVAARLQPLGFWTGRGAVSYTTMGAFVQFLMDRYGPERLRAVYARANFASVYGQPLDSLAQDWAASIHAMPLIARDAEALVTRRFARPSLFEQDCPHYVPPYRRAYRAGQSALAREDTVDAIRHFTAALRDQPRFVAAHRALAQVRLARREADAVIQQLDTLAQADAPALAFALGDAYVIAGQSAAARQQYQTVIQQVPSFEHETRAHVVHRWAVSDRPDVVQVLVSGDSAGAKARRLRALPQRTPAVAVWEARQWMAAGRYERASALWATLPSPLASAPDGQRDILRRERLRWQAVSALRQGDYATAIGQARQAARAFRGVGALNLAAATEDLMHHAQWAQRQSGHVVPSAPADSDDF